MLQRFYPFAAGLLLLAAVLFVTAPAKAASCFRDEVSGLYVCDARPDQPPFSTPGYRPDSLYYERSYAWIDDHAPFFDGPGGKQIDEASEGILYYTVEEVIADAAGNRWYRVDDRWARAENVHPYEESAFSGLAVHSQPERPFGWVLRKFQPASAPDATPPENAPWIDRYTLIEIYDAATGADGWLWFDIGAGQWVKQTYLALVDRSERPAGIGPDEYWVEVDLFEQTAAAYEGDRLVYATPVSTGFDAWPTNEGLFSVYARFREWHMSGGDVGKDYYYLQDVPHTMFFDDEIALHGAYWHDTFGYQQSHGCVNMPPRAAEWIYYWSLNSPHQSAPDGELWVWVHTSPQDHFLQTFNPGAGFTLN